jgi:hypothetical protein
MQFGLIWFGRIPFPPVADSNMCVPHEEQTALFLSGEGPALESLTPGR